MKIIETDKKILSWILRGFIHANKTGGHQRVAYEEAIDLVETSDLLSEQKAELQLELKKFFIESASQQNNLS